jgi:hypothetical protein
LSSVQPRKGDRPAWHLPGALREQLLAIRPDLTLWRDVPIQRLPREAELGTQFGDPGLRFTHRRFSKPTLCWRHLERTPAMPGTASVRWIHAV